MRWLDWKHDASDVASLTQHVNASCRQHIIGDGTRCSRRKRFCPVPDSISTQEWTQKYLTQKTFISHWPSFPDGRILVQKKERNITCDNDLFGFHSSSYPTTLKSQHVQFKAAQLENDFYSKEYCRLREDEALTESKTEQPLCSTCFLHTALPSFVDVTV